MMPSILGSIHPSLFTTGWLMIAAGSAVAWARTAPGRVFGWLRRRFVAEVEVRSNNNLFDYALAWLGEHPSLRRNRNWEARTVAGPAVNVATGKPSPGSSADDQHVEMFPGLGNFLLWQGGVPVWLNRTRQEANREATASETLRLSMMGGSRERLEGLLAHITALARKGREDYQDAYRVATTSWDSLRGLVKRPLETVVLPAGVSERLVADLEAFLAAKESYRGWGIPWRRQLLLEGPPGSGKTSVAQALAAQLRRPLYCMNLSSVFNDDTFFGLLSYVQPGSILLIEDIDGAQATASRAAQSQPFAQHGAGLGATTSDQPAAIFRGPANGVSLSALLNGLDGVFSQDGLITIMTTNYPDRLDPAFLRPGRVDLRIHLGAPAEEQLRRLWDRFLPGEPYDPELLSAINDAKKPSSMAEAQHLLAQVAKANAIPVPEVCA